MIKKERMPHKTRGETIMNIKKESNETTLILTLEGRLDTTTASQLEAELKPSISGITKLVIDMQALEYISSAGLRVLLSAQKVMNKQGEMILRNVGEVIMDVFDVTGFADILTIE